MEIKMPKLGESVHEGTIEQWLVQEGDRVEEYDPLCEVITDKVTAEVPHHTQERLKKLLLLLVTQLKSVLSFAKWKCKVILTKQLKM